MVISFLLCGNAFSQKFHAFLFCKTSDRNIGTSVKINYANMQEALQIVADGLNYQYAEHSLTSLNFNIKNVNVVIDSTNIQPNDIVFMYFSTHGAKSKWDSNIFPQIDIPDTLLAVYKLYKKVLTEKNPKSIVTLIEACSGFLDITPQQAFIYQTAGDTNSVKLNSPLQKQNIQKLFSSDCNIIMTAGQPGKNTWATWQGSMFTNCFLRTLKEYIETPNLSMVTWDNVLKQCKQYTYDMTSSTRIKYYPVWEKSNCSEKMAFDSSQSSISIDTLPIANKVSLIIKCSKAERGRNLYFVKLKIEGSISEINSISKVEYFLDATMTMPIVLRVNKNKNFEYGFSVWGEFPIKAKVFYLDGKVVDLYGEIDFKNSSKIIIKQ